MCSVTVALPTSVQSSLLQAPSLTPLHQHTNSAPTRACIVVVEWQPCLPFLAMICLLAVARILDCHAPARHGSQECEHVDTSGSVRRSTFVSVLMLVLLRCLLTYIQKLAKPSFASKNGLVAGH